jgi:hypothetical protein
MDPKKLEQAITLGKKVKHLFMALIDGDGAMHPPCRITP